MSMLLVLWLKCFVVDVVIAVSSTEFLFGVVVGSLTIYEQPPASSSPVLCQV